MQIFVDMDGVLAIVSALIAIEEQAIKSQPEERTANDLQS